MAQYEAGETIKFIFTGCKDVHIGDPSVIEAMTENVAGVIKMTPLSRPMSARIGAPYPPELHGVSAVLIIAESHIAIHAWTHYQAVRVVVDSCKSIDPFVLESYLVSLLNPDKIQRFVCNNLSFMEE